MSLFLSNISASFFPTAEGGNHTFLDADAEAFSDAIGTLNTTQQAAVDQLVIDLKDDSIWGKCTAIYPFVGGTAAAHAVNLKSPGTYDGTMNGTITHNANGVTGDGSTGYILTGINASSVLTNNNTHLAAYVRSDTFGGPVVGCWSTDFSQRLFLYPRSGGDASANMYSSSFGGRVGVSVASSAGFLIASRIANNDLKLYKAGSQIASQTSSTSVQTLPNATIGILAEVREDGAVGGYSSMNLALISIGAGLSSTDASNYNTAVQAFQSSLSRNV